MNGSAVRPVMGFLRRWIAVALITLANCNGGETAANNTSLNVVVPDGGADENGIDIRSVEYTIRCIGNDDAFLDGNDSFPDDILIDGNLEVVDGRTSGSPPVPTEIWQAFMDLPPGPCLVQLRARDNDGEVICIAENTFVVTADSTTKVNLVLVCNISLQAAVGMADVDATFSFVVGNFCPDQFTLNCVDSSPAAQQFLPPPSPALALTSCEVRFRDGDSTCGNNCDPQSCDDTAVPPVCSPGPDPGVSTTVTCQDLLLYCDGDSTPDSSCTWSGDTLGVTGAPPPPFPSNPGPGNFFVACVPMSQGGSPGVTGTCTVVTTDGDVDCDKTKTVSISCPGLSPCGTFGGDAACEVADGTVCVTSLCDNTRCDGATAAACCVATNAPDGTDCSAENPPNSSCASGVCTAGGCASDPDCNDSNPCTIDLCNLGIGICDNIAGNDGISCLTSVGSGSGTCSGGTCVTDDQCQVASDCADGNDCTQDVCSGVPLGCSNPTAPRFTMCDPGSGNPGECDGFGNCTDLPIPNFINRGSGSTTWSANTTPPGSEGGPGATSGGATVFVPTLNTTISIDLDVRLDVISDGANRIRTNWTITARQFLLPNIANAELSSLSIGAVITGTIPSSIPSTLTPTATGQPISQFLTGDVLSLSSPGAITQGVNSVGVTLGIGGVGTINWDGNYSLALALGGNPLLTLTQDNTTFDVQGSDIVFAVEADPCRPAANPPPPASCIDDGDDCTIDSCNGLSDVAICINEPAVDGTACTNAPSLSGVSVCQAGSCEPAGCTVDGCPIVNECREPPTCDVNTDLCEPAPPPLPNGLSCDGGNGECQNGECVDNCSGVSCDDGNECTNDGQCDSLAGGVCPLPAPRGNGTPCNAGGGPGSGSCANGNCIDNCAGANCDDANDCTIDTCDNSTFPATCSNTEAPAGTQCNVGGGPASGVCGGGTCSPVPTIAAGSGSTTWIANTTPPGGQSGATGGCSVFVTAINNTIFLQVEVTLAVTSDGANNLTTEWTATAQNFLLPTLGNAAEYAGLTITASVTGGTPDTIVSTANPTATDQPIGSLLVADVFTLTTPSEIQAGSAGVIPTNSSVNVNWTGEFTLPLTLNGNPLITLTASLCTFDVQGTGVDFPVN